MTYLLYVNTCMTMYASISNKVAFNSRYQHIIVLAVNMYTRNVVRVIFMHAWLNIEVEGVKCYVFKF